MERGSGKHSGGVVNGAGKAKHAAGTTGKCRGRPRKLSFMAASSRKLGQQLNAGDKVVVRRNNGLLYHGEVLRVEEANDRCQIKFEEGVTLFTLFKDIHKAPGQREASCCVCNAESSDRSSSIVFCDSCALGYHQCCHYPPILTSVVQSRAKFFCKLCTFAASVKLDGNPKFNNSLAANDDLRQILPYKMNLLTWDAQHRTNVEQCYCYCGGPGDWHSKMLQCCRCRQWFHEACIQCLQHPLLYGDCFFMFVCSHCNLGQEYIKRLPFRWVDVAQLALFNLTLNFRHKYYDLDDILMPWIIENQDNLALGNLLEGKSIKSQEIRNKVETSLTGHRSKFMSGREVKKRHTLWGLILRVPPNAPSVVVPLSGPINNDVLNNPSIKGRKTKHILPIQCQSPVPLRYLSRCGLDVYQSIMFRNTITGKLFPEANNNNLTNGYTSNHYYGRLNGHHHGGGGGARSNGHNGHPHMSGSESSSEEEDFIPPLPLHGSKKAAAKTQHSVAKSVVETTVCKMEPQTSPALRDVAPLLSPKPKPTSLDCLVRKLPNYYGMNHPFRTEIEKQTERQQLKHFEARMAFLKKEYADELSTFKLEQQEAKTTNPVWVSPALPEKAPVHKPPPDAKHRRGAKRKAAVEEDEASESVRRSKRSRMHAERYQHLLDSFPRHLPKPEPGESALQRWRWKSVVDQLRFGEKFQVRAWRRLPDNRVDFLLHWDDED